MLKRLEANLKEQEKYRDEADYFGRFPELDAEFHKIMIDSVGRSAMMRMLDSLMLHLARWRNFDVAFDNRVPQLIEEHKKIVEAIAEGTSRKLRNAWKASGNDHSHCGQGYGQVSDLFQEWLIRSVIERKRRNMQRSA